MEPLTGTNRPAAAGALWAAGLWSVSAALLGRHLGIAAGAALAATGILVCLWKRRPGPGLLALPALLVALPMPAPPSLVPEPGPVWLDGIVQSKVADELDAERFRLGRGAVSVRVHAEGHPGLLPGDRVRGVARATTSPLPEGIPPALVAAEGALQVEPGAWSLPRLVAVCRRQLQERIFELWPGERGAFLCTLVLGSGPEVAPDLIAAHRATGLSHLLAVSGAHASMLALLLGVLPGVLGPRRNRLHTRIAGVLLLLYGFVTGMEAPMLRALCAFAVAAFASRAGRHVSLAAVLVPPALLSCAVDPDGILGPSFTLSYAAVAGLWLGAKGPRRTRWERWVLAPLRMSLWASLATAPLTLFWFGQFAPCTVLATPLLAPLVTVLLAGGLLAPVLAMLVPGLGSLLAAPTGALADAYAWAVRTCDLLPGTPVHAWYRPELALLGGMAVLGVLLCWLLRGRRGAAVLLVFASLPHFLPVRNMTVPVLRLFAIGHGQCGLVQFPDGSNVVLDCGSMTHHALGARKVAEALTRRCVDLLVLSHSDADHLNGVADLLQKVPVHAAVLPVELRDSETAQLLQAQGVPVRFLGPGESWSWSDQVQLARPVVDERQNNDECIWIRLQFGKTAVLLPADASERSIDAAILAGLCQPALVLVLPHHGRPNARIDALLTAVQPRLCLVSNRAGEGRSAQGDAAQRSGAEVWATGECGDLELRLLDRLELRPALPRRLSAAR